MAEVVVSVPTLFNSYVSTDADFKISLKTLSPLITTTPTQGTTSTIDQYALVENYLTSLTLGYTFPYAPTDVQINGLGDKYEMLQRPGRKPLVLYSSSDPVSVSFKVIIVSKKYPGRQGVGVDSAEPEVLFLSELAKAKTDLVLDGFGDIISDLTFRITEFGVNSHRFNPQQEMSMIDVSMTFTESIVVEPAVPGMISIKDIRIARNAAVKKGLKAGWKGKDWTFVHAAPILGVSDLNNPLYNRSFLLSVLKFAPGTEQRLRNEGVNIAELFSYFK
jgi:hypothetical protein